MGGLHLCLARPAVPAEPRGWLQPGRFVGCHRTDCQRSASCGEACRMRATRDAGRPPDPAAAVHQRGWRPIGFGSGGHEERHPMQQARMTWPPWCCRWGNLPTCASFGSRQGRDGCREGTPGPLAWDGGVCQRLVEVLVLLAVVASETAWYSQGMGSCHMSRDRVGSAGPGRVAWSVVRRASCVVEPGP